MKITIQETKEDTPFVNNNNLKIVSTEFSSNDLTMAEVAEAFAGLCIAYGYHPHSVSEYVWNEMLDDITKNNFKHNDEFDDSNAHA